jgi:hypothetical protein
LSPMLVPPRSDRRRAASVQMVIVRRTSSVPVDACRAADRSVQSSPDSGFALRLADQSGQGEREARAGVQLVRRVAR